MSGISRDAWISALTEAGIPSEDDQDALTIAEFAEMMGLKRECAKGRLERLVAVGKATKTLKRTITQHGRMFSAVAYRLLEAKTGRKRR